MSADDFKQVFEYEIHRKLSLKAKQSTSEMVMLLNNFKFYDVSNSGTVNKDKWIKTFTKIGLSGFSDKDLEMLFEIYDPNKKGEIDYKHFTMSLYGMAEPIPTGQISNQKETVNANTIQEQNNYQPKQRGQQRSQIQFGDEDPNDKYKYCQQNQYRPPQENQQPQQKQRTPLQPQVNLPPQNEMLCMPPQTPVRNEIKNYFKNLLMQFRKKVNTFDGLTYYTLLSKIKVEENPYTHQIPISSLMNIFASLKIDITIKEQTDFYSLLDLSDFGTITSSEFLRLIRGAINDNRRINVVSAFANLDKEKKGNCSIDLIKKSFNSKAHPDIQLKNSTPNEISNLFNYTFDTYCQYKGIGDIIFLEDFVEYYEAISSCIDNDDYFNDIICRVWGLPMNKVNQPNVNVNQNTSSDLTAATLRKLRVILGLRGTKGIFGVLRLLKLFDKNLNGVIMKNDFIQLNNIYRMNLSNEEIDALFLGNTSINYDLLVKAITGELSEYRKNLVFKVFSMFNTNLLDVEMLKRVFDPSRHPDVAANKKNKDEVYGEFIDNIESYLEYKGKSYNGRTMSIEEFVEYYTMLSVGIEDDAYFEYMMSNCWGMANNSNKNFK